MKKKIKFIPIVLILLISIGFAYLSTQLNINGIANLRQNKWDVYWDNLFIINDSVGNSTISINTKTEVDYTVSLKNPGDYLEFTVDAVNGGTIDAMVDTITSTELTMEQKKYLKQEISYASGSEIQEKHILKKGDRKRYKIIIKYELDDDVDEENLPGTQEITLSFGVNYINATEEAIDITSYSKLETGQNVRAKLSNMGVLFAEDLESIYSTPPGIEEIKRSYVLDESIIDDNHLFSTEDSEYPIYFWIKETVDKTYLYYYTEAETIYLNPDSSHLFQGFYAVKNIDLDTMDTSKVTDMSYMFSDMHSLEKINLKLFNTSNVVSMEEMFSFHKEDVNLLSEIDVSSFDTRKVENMAYMFANLNRIKEFDLRNFDTRSVITFDNMFTGISGMHMGVERILVDYTKFVTSNATDMSGIFQTCSSLKEIDIRGFDTSKATDIGAMFNGCSSLTEIDVSSWDTSNVTNMHYLFSGCKSLTSIDVSGFITNNVVNMANMFAGCSNIENLDISNFNTSKVRNMSGMFKSMSKLKELDLSNFDTSNVESFESTFEGLSSIEYLDLSNFDTGKLKNLWWAFEYCRKLKTLDISSWDTSLVTNMIDLFTGCKELVTVYVGPKFSTESVVNSGRIFGLKSYYGDDSVPNKLVGGNGTTFDYNHMDLSYAKADGYDCSNGVCTSNSNTKGYFTLKTN